MALDSYTALKAAIGTRLVRTDQADYAADYITLTDAAVNRRLRVSAMLARDTAAIGDEYSEVPDDFLAVQSFALNDSPPVKLQFLSPDQMEVAAQGGETGKPLYFSVVGGEFRFYPVPDADYSAALAYYQKIPALSESNDSNWLLEDHPDVYLYGALFQAAMQVRNEELIGLYGPLFETAINDVQQATRADAQGGQLTALPNGFAV
jgi:hypothetical protein